MAKVLVVEDDPLLAEILQEMLLSCGAEPLWVHTGRDAVEAMVSSGVSAVLTDGRFPACEREAQGAHGLLVAEVARWLGIRCVLWSSDDALVETAATRGVTALRKPACMTEVCRLLGVL